MTVMPKRRVQEQDSIAPDEQTLRPAFDIIITSSIVIA